MFSGMSYCKRKPYGSRAALPGLDKDWLTPLEPLAKVIPSWKMEDGISPCVFPALPRSDQIFFSGYVPLIVFGQWTCWILDLICYSFSQSSLPRGWIKQRNLLPERSTVSYNLSRSSEQQEPTQHMPCMDITEYRDVGKDVLPANALGEILPAQPGWETESP